MGDLLRNAARSRLCMESGMGARDPEPSDNNTARGIALAASQRVSRRRALRAAAGLGLAFAANAASSRLAWAEPRSDPGVWVATRRATPLKLGENDQDVRWIPTGVLMKVEPGAKGPRLTGFVPAFGAFGSLDAGAVESVEAPNEKQLREQRTMEVMPSSMEAAEKPARVVGSAIVRFWPEVRRDTTVRTIGHNAPLWIVETVYGEDGEPWYRLSPEAAGANPQPNLSYFVHNNSIRIPRTDNHPLAKNPDRTPEAWFEADVKQPLLLTAYERNQPVWSSLALFGKVPNVTPLGDHQILWRVAKETMTSERVYPPIPRNAPGGYYLENVLYTQYFTRTGAAIHYNYWSSNWGYPGSHGCLGLPLAESKWAWDWADYGVPVIVFA